MSRARNLSRFKPSTTGLVANANIASSAAIAKTKLAALDIVNADINASAAIAATKVGTMATANMPNGSWIMLHSVALGVDAAQIIFDNNYITTAYDDYVMIGKSCAPDTDNDEAVIRVSTANSAGNLVTCGHARSYLRLNANPAQGAEAGSGTHVQIATDLGNDANRGGYFTAYFYGLNNTSHYKYMNFTYTGKHSSDEYTWRGGSSLATTSAVNWLAFKFNAGNIKAGARVALYGIKGSNHS